MILNRQRRIRVALRPLEQFLACVQRSLRLERRGITVCLVSDAAIARLNRTFRGKRGSTDVLSFPADGTRAQRKRRSTEPRPTRAAHAAGEAAYLGDVAIAPQVARRNARQLSRPLRAELRILILHGVLHLMGYDHETDSGEMDRLEQRLRKRLLLT